MFPCVPCVFRCLNLRYPLHTPPFPLHVSRAVLFLSLLLPAVTVLSLSPLGSSCQMRTLDSGIGTFPLPDPVTRSSGRHIPKSESSPGGVTAEPSSHTDPSQSDVKVPSLTESRLHTSSSLGHSLSDPTVTRSNNEPDSQSRLPKLSTSGKTHSTQYFIFHKM